MHRAWVALSIVVLATALVSTRSKPASPSPLQGAWRVTEVTTTGADASTNRQPQPGLYIFTTRHYSIMRVNADKPRPELPADLAKATAAQLRDPWGPCAVNAGTYEASGGQRAAPEMLDMTI